MDEPGQVRINADREYVFFDAEGSSVDLFDIRRELAGGANALSTQRLLDLAGQFQGELLEGLAIPDHQDFEVWLLTERETARRTRASLLQTLVNRLYVEAPEEAVHHARHLVATDRYSVSAHAMLIRALVAAGRREEAEREREISKKQLSDAGEKNLAALTEALSTTRRAPPRSNVSRRYVSPSKYDSARQPTGSALRMQR